MSSTIPIYYLIYSHRDRTMKDLLCKLACGSMPNVTNALPDIGGALCSTPQSLADAHYLTAVSKRPVSISGFVKYM